MSTETKSAEETSAEDAPAKREYRYTRTEVVDKVREILLKEKVPFLRITASLTDITIIQCGEHESAGAICSLLEQPGIFGFDDEPEDGSEFTVTFTKDAFGTVTETKTVLSRLHAEKMYEGEDESEDTVSAEDPEDTPEPKKETKSKGKSKKSKKSEKKPEATIDAPMVETPEDIDALEEPALDALLELHGLDPKTMSEDLEGKREVAKKTVFISE